MTSAQWRRVRDLFELALDQSPLDLTAWLATEAGDDEQVKAEVASLLQHHSAAGAFLAEPVTSRVTDLLAEYALLPGQVVGPYTIEREAGRGGMGRVYLATDARLGRTVALKALPPELVGDASQRERLRREARAAASLTHPGICIVYALEEVDGQLFIATEYVDGHTLREEIERGPRPSAQQALETAREIASALASAHAKGITHRDLKPENVMRGRDGRLKILDFGLARIEVAAGDRLAGETMAARVTLPGTIVGTPAYMAPEQLTGRPVDSRVDVFAFGVLMYEYATGVHPFQAETALALAARVLESEAVPLSRYAPHVPTPLVRVVERCLRKLPEERFSSADEIERALTRQRLDVPAGQGTTWWLVHQLVVIALYVLASVVGWQVKEWLVGWPRLIFVLLAIAATIGGVARGHLVFTERFNRPGLAAERARADPITRVVDLLMGAGLVLDGLMLVPTRELAGALAAALGVGVVLARLILEPATTSAAFPDDHT